ncbi:MAG: M24 family metallopeptidase [Chitinivibrionales bacterium]|nr:M24 family metallopeptidase [Chitinivibrionales bacterium]
MISAIPPVPDSEFAERITKVQAHMAGAAIDLLLAFSTESEPFYSRYLADYWPNFETAGVLIPSSGDPALLIGPESGTYAGLKSRIRRIIRMPDFRESSQPQYPGVTLPSWGDIFTEFKSDTFGIAGWDLLPHFIYCNIEKEFKGAIVNADDIVRSIMMIKSPLELDLLRESARLSELSMSAVLDKIKPGMTETQVVGIAVAAMTEAGAESPGYSLWCTSGKNTTAAIGRPSLKKIERGEMVHLQLGAKYNGYSTAIARPLVFGTPGPSMKKFMQLGCDAENMTNDLMRAGVRASDVARKVHGFITERGYGDTILYGPAHGCGHMECEFPFVETSSSWLLEKNMTFQSDMFLATNKYGFRFEDAVIVRENQPAEELSSLRREVIVL